MSAASPPPSPLPTGMYALAFIYIALACAAVTFAVLQLADARSQRSQEALVDRGENLPQGRTVMPNGDVYTREGNLVTLESPNSKENRGWYVGDDPRAAGGTIGRGPGRVSREYLLGVGVAVIGCGAIGGCCLVRREWAWRFVYAAQMFVGAFGGVCALFWFTVAVWLIVAGGKNGGIGLVIAPVAIAFELIVVGLALFALWYLKRPAVRSAFGVPEVKRPASIPSRAVE